MQQTAIYLLLVLALVGYAEDPASLMGEACENTMRVIGQLFAPVPDIEDIIRRSVSAMPAVLTASAGCKIFKLCTYNNCGVNGYCGPLLPNLPKVMVCKCHPTTDNKPKVRAFTEPRENLQTFTEITTHVYQQAYAYRQLFLHLEIEVLTPLKLVEKFKRLSEKKFELGDDLAAFSTELAIKVGNCDIRKEEEWAYEGLFKIVHRQGELVRKLKKLYISAKPYQKEKNWPERWIHELDD
ncbi:hypothetical protein QR680_007261 [Steinernema hermaphroditum]|uniref:Phlebovirus glycoprotein G2 fusion domain-containing protein n=1 Tax=Steinernema hermaphroditum TaxID=289476 RepID=A0AA39I0H7_9BILA|nr:hypothetical protein QR680_007261 [Steinernema hermaphroditum]